jgi:hypothetical protein
MLLRDIPHLLHEQARLDRGLNAFGANAHEYKLNPPIALKELEGFESEHRIKLPEDFREFLLTVGNGGAGPYYGLFPLGFFDGSGHALESWKAGDGFAGRLNEKFPHAGAWNFAEEEFEPPEFTNDDDEELWHNNQDCRYWAPHLVDGSFPICHQGCAYRNLLVVSGPERGNIWLDARAGDGGITPVSAHSNQRVTFLEWYCSWLQSALTFR